MGTGTGTRRAAPGGAKPTPTRRIRCRGEYNTAGGTLPPQQEGSGKRQQPRGAEIATALLSSARADQEFVLSARPHDGGGSFDHALDVVCDKHVEVEVLLLAARLGCCGPLCRAAAGSFKKHELSVKALSECFGWLRSTLQRIKQRDRRGCRCRSHALETGSEGLQT